ncbi:Tubulin-tyrosine ligase family protein [Toxoplasma gondii VAND]|uniref:Tubulin-tyrosine ligase family protein n=2 Tax=Toxoplasma gondii TaxID=5811 RepID=A0A086PNT1_TOXGO|nr:Tubulin-tyrosine ligase family protein [Toxoplasma gondii MAS]KFH04987.1 Tubulin-tyrosine ligase family protein [Toxoplasma gondii VAND]
MAHVHDANDLVPTDVQQNVSSQQKPGVGEHTTRVSSAMIHDSSSSFCRSDDGQIHEQYETFLCSASDVSASVVSSSPPLQPGTLRKNADRAERKKSVQAAISGDYFSQFVNDIRSIFFDKCVAAACTLPMGSGPVSKVRDPCVTLDLSQAGKEKPLIESCVRSLGWKTNNSLFPTGDIAWLGFALTDGEHLDYASVANVVNRFPGLHEFAKKRWLARIISSMALFDSESFSFFPKTWLLPEDREAVETALRVPSDCSHVLGRTKREGRGTAESSCRRRRSFLSSFCFCGSRGGGLKPFPPQQVKAVTAHISAPLKPENVYIIKPDAGTQGAGLKLVSNLDQIPKEILEGQDGYIVQQYICNPFLLHNRKFDFRVYVLLTAVTPKLNVFVSRRSLVRFCTEDYESPRPGNMNNEFMHLTNYAINKDHHGFVRSSNVHDRSSSKRLLDDVLEDLRQQDVDVEYVWQQIVFMVEKVMTAFKPLLALKYDSIYRQTTPRSRCFQIIGLDILLDSNCKAWLLEVNGNPSLRSDYEYQTTAGFISTAESLLDRRIKEPLISEALVIVYFSLLGTPSQVSSCVNEENGSTTPSDGSTIPPAQALRTSMCSRHRAGDALTRRQLHIPRNAVSPAAHDLEPLSQSRRTQPFSLGRQSSKRIPRPVPRCRVRPPLLVPGVTQEPPSLLPPAACVMSPEYINTISNEERGVHPSRQPLSKDEDEQASGTVLPTTATTTDTTRANWSNPIRTASVRCQRTLSYAVLPKSDPCPTYNYSASLASGTLRPEASAPLTPRLSRSQAASIMSVRVSDERVLRVPAKREASQGFGGSYNESGLRRHSDHFTGVPFQAHHGDGKTSDSRTDVRLLEFDREGRASYSGSTASGRTPSGGETQELSLREPQQWIHKTQHLAGRDTSGAKNDTDVVSHHCCLWIPVETSMRNSSLLPPPSSLLDMCKILFTKVTRFPCSLTIQLKHWVALISRGCLKEAIQQLWVPVYVASQKSQHFSLRNPRHSSRRTCRRFAQRPLARRDLIFLYMQQLKLTTTAAGQSPEPQGLSFWSFWEIICLFSSLTRLFLGSRERPSAAQCVLTKPTCAESDRPASQIADRDPRQGRVLLRMSSDSQADACQTSCSSLTFTANKALSEPVWEIVDSYPCGRRLRGCNCHEAPRETRRPWTPAPFSDTPHTCVMEDSCFPSSRMTLNRDFKTPSRDGSIFVPWWPDLHRAFNSLRPSERTAAVSSLLTLLLVEFDDV